MEEIVGKPIKRNHIKRAIGDARHTAADVSKANRILSYKSLCSLKEGLALEWEWVKDLYVYAVKK